MFINTHLISVPFYFAYIHSDHTGHEGIGHGRPPYAKLGFSCDTITSSHIQAALEQLQLPYTSSTIVESTDVSSFLCDNISTDGDLLLDIFVGKKHFRKTSSVKVCEAVLGYYKENARTKTSYAGDVKSFYDATNVIFSISKEE